MLKIACRTLFLICLIVMVANLVSPSPIEQGFLLVYEGLLISSGLFGLGWVLTHGEEDAVFDLDGFRAFIKEWNLPGNHAWRLAGTIGIFVAGVLGYWGLFWASVVNSVCGWAVYSTCRSRLDRIQANNARAQ